jgi:hypothetical protein
MDLYQKPYLHRLKLFGIYIISNFPWILKLFLQKEILFLFTETEFLFYAALFLVFLLFLSSIAITKAPSPATAAPKLISIPISIGDPVFGRFPT